LTIAKAVDLFHQAKTQKQARHAFSLICRAAANTRLHHEHVENFSNILALQAKADKRMVLAMNRAAEQARREKG